MKKLIVTIMMVSLTIAGLFAMDGSSSLKNNLLKSEPLAAKVIRNAGDKLNIKTPVINNAGNGMVQIHAILNKKNDSPVVNFQNNGYFIKGSSAGGVK